ncbi:MAG: PAS domain-containing protein, partial [Actinomycetota bacterium]
MSGLLEALRFLQPFVFGGLWLVALFQWRRRGGEATGALALTFGALAVPLVAGRILPEDPAGILLWVSKIDVAVLILFPYFLYRFTGTFGGRSPKLDVAAAIATAVSVALAFAAPENGGRGPMPPLLAAFVVVVVAQWAVLSLTVAARLWRWGRGQAAVARRRMRTMSLGALGLALAIVLAGGQAGGEAPTGLLVATQLVALASAPLFLLGFAPPGIVRMLWRRREEESLREAHFRLMEATTPGEVADILLPSAASLVGGGGAALAEGSGALIGAHGLTDAEGEKLVERARTMDQRPTRDEEAATTVGVPLRSGFLAIEATPYTPFFGREETGLVRHLAVLAELALERTSALQREIGVREQLMEAQRLARIGSWEWDVRADRIVWSEELYRITGLDPERFGASLEAFMERVHEDDRSLIRRHVQDALTKREAFDYEHRLVRSDGEIRVMHARGKPVEDDEGNVVRMIGTSQDVTEQKRQEAFREQFIANAAHEMRTPLTTLTGFVEVLSHQDQE